MVGLSLSFTVTVNEQLAVRPEPSVTVYVSVVVPTGKVLPGPRPLVREVEDPEQLSLPTGAVYDTAAPQTPASLLTVIAAGQEIVGFSESVTVTVKEHDAVLPVASVTANVCVVTPMGKLLPEASPAVRAVLAPGQLSVPTGVVYVTVAAHDPLAALTETGEGHVIEGAWLSFTVTVNEHEAVSEAWSVTTNVLVVLPSGKLAPEASPAVLDVVAPGH